MHAAGKPDWSPAFSAREGASRKITNQHAEVKRLPPTVQNSALYCSLFRQIIHVATKRPWALQLMARPPISVSTTMGRRKDARDCSAEKCAT